MNHLKTNSLRAWWLASRPKTLAVAAAPVLVGCSLAYRAGYFALLPSLICLLFAILMQIDANFINDYFDCVKGADREDRLGPKRACAQGWITLPAMRRGMYVVSIVAVAVGSCILFFTDWLLIPVGVLCVVFALAYTAGPYPLAYHGWGDVLVLVFFGIVPVCCTYYVLAATCTLPVLMASENWDDHDRSEKYAARDFAENYLASVKDNGILITFGDNDTFPLWYAQEVEGFRTDVRILNYTLSGMHWYVEQLYNKLYESEAIEFTLPKEFYGLGRDMVYIQDRGEDYYEVTDVLALLRDHPEQFKVRDQRGEEVILIPTSHFKITLDIPDLVSRGVIPAELADKVEPVIKWQVTKGNLFRHELMMLDIIGTNKFRRDINIMNPGYIKEVFPPIRQYCVQDGMNYKVLPYPAKLGQPVLFDKADNQYTLQSFTESSYDYFLKGYKGADGEMHPLQWGNLDADIYVDPVSDNMGTVQRQSFTIAAKELMQKGDTIRARQMLEMSDSVFPEANFPYDKYSFLLIEVYKDAFGVERAAQIWDSILEYYTQDQTYYSQYLSTKKASGVEGLLQENAQMFYSLSMIARQALNDDKRAEQANTMLQSTGFGY